MKKLVVVCCSALVMFACGQQAKKQKSQVVETKNEVIALTVDELLEQASDLTDNEVLVKGTVMHVCQHGGERCFLMGSNEDITIRVEAGESFGTFSQEQMGSDLEITGILKEVKTEADAHNPGKEHGEEAEEHEENASIEQAHKKLAENQEAAERVYFIEGLKVKEN